MLFSQKLLDTAFFTFSIKTFNRFNNQVKHVVVVVVVVVVVDDDVIGVVKSFYYFYFDTNSNFLIINEKFSKCWNKM